MFHSKSGLLALEFHRVFQWSAFIRSTANWNWNSSLHHRKGRVFCGYRCASALESPSNNKIFLTACPFLKTIFTIRLDPIGVLIGFVRQRSFHILPPENGTNSHWHGGRTCTSLAVKLHVRWNSVACQWVALCSLYESFSKRPGSIWLPSLESMATSSMSTLLRLFYLCSLCLEPGLNFADSEIHSAGRRFSDPWTFFVWSSSSAISSFPFQLIFDHKRIPSLYFRTLLSWYSILPLFVLVDNGCATCPRLSST